MGIIKTTGIVINEANSKDSDKVLTMLTPDLGKIAVVVKGAKKSNNTNLASSQLLTLSEVVLYKNLSDVYVLNSAEVIEMFYEVRVDIEKLYYSTYLCKLVCDVATEDDNSFELMQLFLNTIYLISKNNSNYTFYITVFQIRLLRILGFMPKINKCVLCGKEMAHSFSIKHNGILCPDCVLADKGAIEFSPSMFNSVKYILLSESKKVFSFKITENVLSELKMFIKIYLQEKLDKEYDIDKYIRDINV